MRVQVSSSALKDKAGDSEYRISVFLADKNKKECRPNANERFLSGILALFSGNCVDVF